MNTNAGKDSGRRNFLKLAGYAIILAPLARSDELFAADTLKLDEAGPAASALGYRHDVRAVDREKFPRSAPVEGVQPVCQNCALYQTGGEDEWGACGIFPGKLVNAKGWCSAWAPKGWP